MHTAFFTKILSIENRVIKKKIRQQSRFDSTAQLDRLLAGSRLLKNPFGANFNFIKAKIRGYWFSLYVKQTRCAERPLSFHGRNLPFRDRIGCRAKIRFVRENPNAPTTRPLGVAGRPNGPEKRVERKRSAHARRPPEETDGTRLRRSNNGPDKTRLFLFFLSSQQTSGVTCTFRVRVHMCGWACRFFTRHNSCNTKAIGRPSTGRELGAHQ